MLEGLWEGASDILGEGLSSMLEQILNATIFKLFYYLESALCWLIGVLMELFEVFAGLEPVTYNGQEQYLVNVFFANKAISNIYWGMAIIGMVLIFVFTGWAVIRKMFDIDGKQQQSMGQIIWGAVRSLFLIIGLTLVVNVVISATSILMRQIDYIFNNAYHLDLPQEREFSDEEYAAMGRILATVGNYSMIPNSNNRYNLNLCFNDIRTDMLFLQNQGVFEYSYYDKVDGVVVESWQSVLARIAKSANLNQDVKIDVYNDSVANSITFAMNYLRSSGNPVPVERVDAGYTVTERAHLDRLVFLLGTFRAAKNNQFNEHPAFDDPLRGPYYFEEGRSIYEYDQVNEDFDIGFKTDYILVWFSAVALIFNLVIIVLNCVARIFNLMLLYIIAPPFIASTPLDNGGKFKQWTTAFIIQSLSVFGTVIAMQLLLLYLPIVASPDLVLFKDKPLLNALAQFMLVFGGVEAAKKAGSLVTGILADQAGMEAIRSGDMSGAANRMINSATNAAKGVAGAAMGVAGFALAPVTNLAKRPFKAAGDFWRKLGSGGRQARNEKAIKDEISKNKAIEEYKKKHKEDAKYLGGGSGENPKTQTETSTTQTNTDSQNTDNQTRQPPPMPVPRGKTGGSGKSQDTNDLPPSRSKDPNSSVNNIRNRGGFNGLRRGSEPARDMNATSNRPTLDRPPAAPQQDAPAGNNNNRDNNNQNNNNNFNPNPPQQMNRNGNANMGGRQGQGNDPNQPQRPRRNSVANGPRGNRMNNNMGNNQPLRQDRRGYAPQGDQRGIDRRSRFQNQNQNQNQGNRMNNVVRQNVAQPPEQMPLNQAPQYQQQNNPQYQAQQGQNPQYQQQGQMPLNQAPQYQQQNNPQYQAQQGQYQQQYQQYQPPQGQMPLNQAPQYQQQNNPQYQAQQGQNPQYQQQGQMPLNQAQYQQQNNPQYQAQQGQYQQQYQPPQGQMPPNQAQQYQAPPRQNYQQRQNNPQYQQQGQYQQQNNQQYRAPQGQAPLNQVPQYQAPPVQNNQQRQYNPQYQPPQGQYQQQNNQQYRAPQGQAPLNQAQQYQAQPRQNNQQWQNNPQYQPQGQYQAQQGQNYQQQQYQQFGPPQGQVQMNQAPQYQAPPGNPVQPPMQPPPLRQNNFMRDNRRNNNNNN